jgi:hypothetical protein
MNKCTHCDRSFKSIWGKHAHERYHLDKMNLVVSQTCGEDLVDWESIGDWNPEQHNDEDAIGSEDFENVIEDLRSECLKYISIQRRTLSPELVNTLEAGFPILLNGSRKVRGDIRTYFEVVHLVINLRNISLTDADSILVCMRRISRLHGEEIPLPAKYSTILDNIMRGTKSIKSRVLKKEFPLCKEVFGERLLSQLPFQHGVVTDLVKVVGKIWIVMHNMFLELHNMLNINIHNMFFYVHNMLHTCIHSMFFYMHGMLKHKKLTCFCMPRVVK